MIEVIIGCMSSGKSRYLNSIRRNLNVEETCILIPSNSRLKSLHYRDLEGNFVEITTSPFFIICPDSIPFNSLQWLFKKYRYIFVDECQFLSVEWIQELIKLENSYGTHLYIAGLDTDYRGNMFPSTKYAIQYSHKLKKLFTICMSCGERATHNYLVSKDEIEDSLVNAVFEPRCINCFNRLDY